MLTRRHIERLNAPQKRRNPVSLVAGGAALLALLLFVVGFLLLGSLLVGVALAVVAFLVGGGVVFFLQRRYAKARSVEIRYGMMDAATSARFSRIQKAFEVLVASDRIWRVEQDARTVETRPVEIRVIDPPGLSTDVDVWKIDTGSSSAFFLPEAVLVYEEGKYRAISYHALQVELSSEKTVEEGELPGDAEVVGKTWRYLAEDGTSPDRTRSFNNPQLPQVVYGLLRLRAGNWDGPDFWVSNESAAAQFVLAFLDVSPNPDRVERWYGTRPYEDRGKGDPAYSVLGLEDGAPRNEVTAAYRRIARAYHPDRTANFIPEFRTLADQRMKEINAAYSRLRREAT